MEGPASAAEMEIYACSVSEVCFSVGAGNLSWEETVLQGWGEAEFCGANQACSHSKNSFFMQDFPNTKPANKPQAVHG